MAKDKKAIERLRLIEDTDLKWLMGQRQGRRFVWRMLGACRMADTSFEPDPYLAAYRTGMQNAGNFVRAEIMRVCPEKFAVMQEEAHLGERAEADSPPGREGDGED